MDIGDAGIFALSRNIGILPSRHISLARTHTEMRD